MCRMLATHEKFTELGLESPFTDEWFARPSQDDRITTQVSLEGYEEIRFEAERISDLGSAASELLASAR